MHIYSLIPENPSNEVHAADPAIQMEPIKPVDAFDPFDYFDSDPFQTIDSSSQSDHAKIEGISALSNILFDFIRSSSIEIYMYLYQFIAIHIIKEFGCFSSIAVGQVNGRSATPISSVQAGGSNVPLIDLTGKKVVFVKKLRTNLNSNKAPGAPGKC